MQKRKIALLAAAAELNEQKRRRWYVRPHIAERETQGDYYSLLKTTRLSDPECFFNILRVTPTIFDQLLHLMESRLYRASRGRAALPPGLRLGCTLRYLASGDLMVSCALNQRIGKSTTSNIIRDTCNALWEVLQNRVLKPPTREDWLRIANEFNNIWQIPNTLASMDGKHVVTQCFAKSGSTFFNHKGTFSIVLLACCDARYKFLMVDIGASGRQSDGGILAASNFGQAILSQRLPVPGPKCLPCTNIITPHVFLGDEAFPLRENILRPYPGKFLDPKKTIFNYRQSRGRRVIENAFGIMSARWRIFRRPIIASVETVEAIVKASVCLHNLMAGWSRKKYIPPFYADSDGDTTDGLWRYEEKAEGLADLPRTSSNNSSRNAQEIREAFADFFFHVGRVDWQWNKLPNYQNS